ncbi:TspO/MBR-like protein [Mycena albidolilacea]|uniref:TspO/MBR-like protein n=1 Tax=Mycena albidolilacea TaxID=1033008 RepID=A0AAD7AUQ4_9AGAR|nr:TspO/MBR-like protein [Mycena albidolilacea]
MSNLHLPTFLLTVARVPLLAVGLPLGLGLLSGYPTAKVVQSDWYKNLRTPPGRPPRQVFPVVWPLLYISMGYASHLVVNALDGASSPSAKSDYMLVLALYYTQLGLNLAWTPLFFAAKKTGMALIDSGIMTAATFYMTKLLAAHYPAASYLLWPYCAWLSFATYLNGGIWWLNRRTHGNAKHE